VCSSIQHYTPATLQSLLMSIGLYDRLIGRPTHATGLIKFLDYGRRVERVWFCRGIDTVRHWQKVHPYQASV
jgi:hypothetical protein